MAARDYFWPVVSLLPDDVPYAERNAILRWGIAALGMLGMILGPVCWQLARARLMRLRADELTHRSEVRLRNIHETASDAIITGDSRGKISGWNQGAENIFGYEENEAVGKPLTLIMPDRFHEAHEKGLERYVKTHETRVVGQTVELVGRRKCGEEFPVELSLNFWVTSEGEFFTGILRDISSRKEVEDQLREARRSAEAASIAKSDFLANMSHEIRTPMNGIIGMTDLLMDTALSDEQHDYLKMARDSGHALLHIINEILDFSKIEAGKLEITPANFSLRHCIGDTLKLLAQRSDEKELELLWDMPHEIPDALNGDPGRIRQILTNLIGNAIKFTEEGEILVRVAWKEGEGSVEGLEDGSGGVVEASGLKSSTSTPPSTHEPMPPSRTPTLPHSRASTHQKSVNLHFSVKDTGIGIPKEEQQAVFDSFTQVDSSSTRSHGGTGLGLAISSRLVSLMGGQIWLESETGTGSTFHFSLPLALQEYPRKRIITRQMQTLREISALVVDDNATNRRILQGLLGKWHMPTTIVGSGQAALQAIAQACNDGKPFGVAILDSQMPGMDGFMLAERIQEDRGLKTPRLILLTSAGRPGDAERCRSLGIDAYLHKPINPSDLQDAILLVTSSEDKEDQPREVITQHSLHEAKRAYRVLLAEDNEINQLLATRLLENHGYSVVLANNGREAVDAFQQEPFDVILMDVRMPEMDGFQATAAIRELEANGNHPLEDSNQKTPIIALTAHAMEGDREKCIEAGMDEHVSKPITPDKLFRVINRLLAKEQETSDQQVEQLPSTTGSIDLKAIMDRTEGDMELAREVIQVFIDASDRLITEMDDCFAEGDAAALRDTAHSIKGSAGNFGAGRVSQAASELEIAAGQKELIGASAKLNQLKEEMVELVCELKQFMNGDSS
jgi:PAS domain S-box-containing protein